MEHGIKELAQMSGLTTRTLRYYDEINLLKPSRIGENGYRFYDSKCLDTLQQILFYRKRGFELKKIKDILSRPDYDVKNALKEHLAALEEQKYNLDYLIESVKLTLLAMEGEYEMSDKEKFEALKKAQVEENEVKYGKEVREKYGDEAMEESYRKMLDMTEEQYNKFRSLEDEILEKLQAAVKEGKSPESEAGKEITALHKEWLLMTWNQYSPDAHRGLALMYTCDERFKAYYDYQTEGCVEFIQKAIEHWA